MIIQRYLGGFYELYFEEVKIRFLVHQSLIGKDTRSMILQFMDNGTLPDRVTATLEDHVVCFQPDANLQESTHFHGEALPDYFWFAL